MKIYRDGDKLVKDTGQAPPQFRGVLSIVYAGCSPETVEESVYPSDELRALPEANIATLSQEWKEAFGLPIVESKSTTGSQSPLPAERRATGEEEVVPSPLDDDDDDLTEYYEPLHSVWSSWLFFFSPVVVIWLPYAIMVTALYGFVALFDYLYDTEFSFGVRACALTALALSAYMFVRLI